MTEVSLERMIANLRKLGRGFTAEVAKEAMPGVLAAVQATAAAGTSPTGQAWKPRKEDGAMALANASKHITARVIGTIIQLQLEYPYSIHHYQAGTETRPRRQVLPDEDDLGPGVNRAINDAIERVFRRTMGGG